MISRKVGFEMGLRPPSWQPGQQSAPAVAAKRLNNAPIDIAKEACYFHFQWPKETKAQAGRTFCKARST